MSTKYSLLQPYPTRLGFSESQADAFLQHQSSGLLAAKHAKPWVPLAPLSFVNGFVKQGATLPQDLISLYSIPELLVRLLTLLQS